MTLREYKEGDYETIRDAVEPFMPSRPGAFGLHIDSRLAVSAEDKGRVIACGGLLLGDEDLVWLKVSNGCKVPISLFRAIKEIFEIMKRTSGRAVYCYILYDFGTGRRLAKLLGLRFTGSQATHAGRAYLKYSTN